MSVSTEILSAILILVTFVSLGLLFLNIRATRDRIRRIRDEYHEKLELFKIDRDSRLFKQSKYTELGMMSAGIAHEINNPLAVIQARATQLLRAYRDPARVNEVGEGLQQILYTSERIGRTIQGVRDFIRQDDQSLDQEVSLKKIIDDVLAFCGQRMKNHGINLRLYNIDQYKVIGNKIQLEQVFLNLLNNAFDAIEFLPDKWIEISAHDVEGKIQVYIKDSGSGIPTEIASRIMEPFYSTKEAGKGTGLGLALASGIAEKHGGKLSYVPKGNHTTFLLEFPKPKSFGDHWHRQNASVRTRELH